MSASPAIPTLLLVDLQNDFLPGGALAVPRGDEVIPIANRLMPAAGLVVATMDWHPADHVSFAANHPGHEIGEDVEADGLPQHLWPVHCVQQTTGAELAEGLDQSRIHHRVRKGTEQRIDSYSGFFDNGHRRGTGLHEYLQQRGVRSLAVMGLATDYCVKFTVLDALRLGYEVQIVEDGCRGVELRDGDCRAALDEMRKAGGEIVHSADLLRGTGESA